MKRSAMLGATMAVLVAIGAAGGPALGDENELRVNSVVVDPAPSLEEAQAKAMHEALARALKSRGSRQIPEAMAKEILAEPGRYVTVRHVLNKEPVKGKYQPAFYLAVDLGQIAQVVNASNDKTITAYENPRIQVAINIQRLPKDFAGADDRRGYIDDLQATVKEYFGRSGFNLVDFLNFDAKKLYTIDSLEALEEAAFNPDNPPTAIDYYLLGQLDAPEGSVAARDGGSYYKAEVKLVIKLIDLNTGQAVNARRTVEGTGESARSSLDNAVQNVSKAIIERANVPDILDRWKRNMQQGMQYEVAFCEKALKNAYFDDLRTALDGKGKLSGAKSDEIPLHVFQFPAGSGTDPAKGLELILADLQKAGTYADTTVKPRIYKKHKIFMFGNDPNCFGAGQRRQGVAQ